MIALVAISSTNASVVLAKRSEAGGILAGAPVSNITVYIDTLAECGWTTISWTGAVAPVSLMIGLGGYYVGTTTLETHDDLNDPEYGWTVSQPSGEDMIFQITDANGQIGYIQNQQVTAGDGWCLSSSSSSSVVASTSTGTDSVGKSYLYIK
ncbi:hypothetical protein BCR39DRAFT_471893 [Naematelia encephala]|uniref:Uncharacterized protein n=1 Tax=Naematelia encephala TaxID=71784 RepID=A0A1Y2AR66_9TREE|nr:hypothetical protein BCR39DRAFT_471893 [Naematelia encephala]